MIFNYGVLINTTLLIKMYYEHYLQLYSYSVDMLIIYVLLVNIVNPNTVLNSVYKKCQTKLS